MLRAAWEIKEFHSLPVPDPHTVARPHSLNPHTCPTLWGAGDDFYGAPDLDHTNPDLRLSLVDWLNWLKTEIGFEGWRFDMVKG